MEILMEQDFSFLLTHFAQNYTAFHTRHFCELTYAMLYACWYKDLLGDFTDLDLPFLAVAASLHDIGKKRPCTSYCRVQRTTISNGTKGHTGPHLIRSFDAGLN